jgi:hypothetical protein
MRYPLLVLSVVATVLLGGCSSRFALLRQQTEAVPEANRAYIIGSYAIDCAPRESGCSQAFNSISTFYRAVDDHDAGDRLSISSGSMFGGDTVPDFIRPDRRDKGIHFCVPLPAGKYSIYSYDFYNYAGGGSGYSFRKDNYFNLPFTLAAGEVAYLGTLKVTTSVGENFFGMKMAAPGVLMLSSSPVDGVAAALQKCPESVRGRPVRDASLRVADAATPFVRADPKP